MFEMITVKFQIAQVPFYKNKERDLAIIALLLAWVFNETHNVASFCKTLS